MSNVASISQIRSKYLRLRWFETVLFGLSAMAIVASIAIVLNLSLFLVVALAAVAGLLTSGWRWFSLGLSKVDDLKVSLYLNRFYPELKDSSDLLIKDSNSLSVLEQIQLNRIDSAISNLNVELPHQLKQASVAIVIAGVLFFTAFTFAPHIQSSLTSNTQHPTSNDEVLAPLDPSIRSSSVTITPPSYTRLSKTESTNLTFSAVEGSTATWKLTFHQPVDRLTLKTTNGDSVVINVKSEIQNSKSEIELSYTLTTSILYRLNWTIGGQNQSSDYYRIDVKPDAIPQVSIKELPQFTRLKWGERNTIDVVSGISDDYGLTDAHVIATVSKGSGESVKFREEKIPFASPSKINGTSVTGKLTLNFHKLGMEPGDEVYFYVEAFDNKQPQPQRNRTDTYFVALQDTATNEMVMDEGLGVDLMPDYFRSQRQLIIDTEKLLADQKAGKVTKQQFNFTSNELGYDQKVLRLRYGQFLGEEFETSIGGVAADEIDEDRINQEKEEADDILKKYGHQHDTENEHNHVADKKGKDEELNDAEKQKEEVLGQFSHSHDSEEEATFFTQSIKAKLRAALTLMWDSELKLRMYQPKESLPTQYQILKLLKEISNDSRIYVHRMGFDPPPLKEDKRLTGSLDEVKPARIENKVADSYEYPAMRLALTDISTALLNESVVLTDQQRSNLHAAGDELATLALKLPGNYLKPLSDLKLIAENKIDAGEIRVKLEGIQKAFWAVLPNEAPSPTQRGSGSHPLDVKFLQEIKTKAND